LPERVRAPWGTGTLGSGASRWWVLGWALPMVVQLVHALAVAPTYHVGSFDDDANYLMAAHVLASGGGLTTTMPSGAAVVADYLPGYPLLLVPLVWIWGGSLVAPRALAALCVAAIYPLAWAWMGHRSVRHVHRVAVLGILALNTVLATYATMVMAEGPFLVVLLLALLAIDRWERQPGWRWACVVVLLLGYMVWLKEAGVGLVAGLVLYELWRHRWRRAAGVSAGVGLVLLPGVVARLVTGGAVVGDRYAGEISSPSQGGLLHQLPSEVVNDLWTYVSTVLRQSVLPAGAPLPASGPVHLFVVLFGVTVPVLCLVGAVAWYRRHPVAETWMVLAYFAETLGYPFTNQRRVLLVLPVVVLWYVTGACAAGAAVAGWSARVLGRLGAAAAIVLAILAASVPTAAGFTKNYLFPLGKQSSEFAASPAMELLRDIGPASLVVETDYMGSVAYFTGHRTAWTAFVETTSFGPFAGANKGACTPANVRAALMADDASLLVVGDFNVPGQVDSPCLLGLASSARTSQAIGAVRLLSTSHDDTSVFELVGPHSSQPGLADRSGGPPQGHATAVRLAPNGQGDVGGTAYTEPSRSGAATFEWRWRAAEPLEQVSVGSVVPAPGTKGTVRSVKVSVEVSPGKWDLVDGAAGPVGNGDASSFLFAALPPGTRAFGVRVVALTRSAAEVSYVDAIGPVRGAHDVPQVRGRAGRASGGSAHASSPQVGGHHRAPLGSKEGERSWTQH